MSGTTQCSSSLSLLVSPDLCYFLLALPGTEGVVPEGNEGVEGRKVGTLSPLLLLPLEMAPAKLWTLLDPTDALLSHPRQFVLLPADTSALGTRESHQSFPTPSCDASPS